MFAKVGAETQLEGASGVTAEVVRRIGVAGPDGPGVTKSVSMLSDLAIPDMESRIGVGVDSRPKIIT